MAQNGKDTEERLLRLERLVIGGRQGTQVGFRWRLTEAPYPTEAGEVCLLLQSYVDDAWRTVIVLTPNGTLLPAGAIP